MFKKLFWAALAVSAVFATGAQAQDKAVLKWAVFTPEQELTFVRVMKPFAEKVMADAQGTLEIQMYPNGALGRDPTKQLKMVQDGVADIAWIIPAYNPGRFPDNEVFELPNIIHTSVEGSVAAWNMLQKGMLRGYEEFYMIGLFTSSPYTFHSKAEVTKMDDLKGKKIRAVGPSMVDSVKALGAAPEAMPFPAIPEAISRGVIDGTTGHPIAVRDFGVADVTSYHYMAPIGAVNLAIIMSKAKYDALPAPAKAALDKHRGEAMSIAFGEMSESVNKELTDKWGADPKRKVTIPSEAEMAAWDKALAPVTEKFAKADPKNAQLVEALRAEIKSVRAKK